MIISISHTMGPVRYELADVPPRLTEEFGEPLLVFTLQNVRTQGQATIYLRLEEVDRLHAAKRKLAR